MKILVEESVSSSIKQMEDALKSEFDTDITKLAVNRLNELKKANETVMKQFGERISELTQKLDDL